MSGHSIVQQEQMALMLQVTQDAMSSLQMDEVLKHVGKGIAFALGVPHCNFYLYDESRNLLIPRQGYDEAPLSPEALHSFLNTPISPITNEFSSLLLEKKEPLISADAQTDPRVDKDLVGPVAVKSVMAVPLVIYERVVAIAMIGEFEKYRAFSEEEVKLVRGMAGPAALAIENARLYEESAKRQEENQSIQRVTSALLQELDLMEVLAIVCSEAKRLTGSPDSSVYLFESEGWLECVYTTADHPVLDRIPTDGALCGVAIREGRAAISNDPANDERIYHLKGVLPINMLVVPLSTNTNSSKLGVVYLANKPGGFTQDDARLIRIFADQAAVAVKNAQLHQREQYLAVLEERERLSREIHDNVAQTMSILKLQATNISELLRSGQIEPALSYLNELNRTASEANADIREAIFNLRNSASTETEFIPSLRTYLTHYQKLYGIEIHLLLPEEERKITLPPTSAIQVTRIIQEALTNVRKHAHARRGTVQIELENLEMKVTVEDDGMGFDLREVTERDGGGVGLQVMRERVVSLGGRFELDGRPGRGACVQLWVPLPVRR